MKNILILFTCILLFSCKKQETNSPITNELISQILKEKNIDLQRNMFQTLNPTEKSNTWKTKFKLYLENNNLNKSQITYINNLIEIIKPQIFDNENKSSNFDDKKLREDAVILFGISESMNILTTLSKDATTTEAGGCTCSKNSDWCSNDLTCKNWICEVTSSGCGTLWNYSCNGKCWF